MAETGEYVESPIVRGIIDRARSLLAQVEAGTYKMALVERVTIGDLLAVVESLTTQTGRDDG